jgi:nucleoside 2-deoxyribosyltransferase
MKIFLSGSVRGGRRKLSVYRHMAELLEKAGHEVVSLHVTDPLVEEKEAGVAESAIYAKDMHLLGLSDCMIAEVSVASTGVGYEICSALALGLPVLCVHEEHANVSAMILGNTNGNILVWAYRDLPELGEILANFLSSLSGKC